MFASVYNKLCDLAERTYKLTKFMSSIFFLMIMIPLEKAYNCVFK